jgi:hypothetical protein
MGIRLSRAPAIFIGRTAVHLNTYVNSGIAESKAEARSSACYNVGLMERETGIEPATSSLGSWRSTAELLPLTGDANARGAQVQPHAVNRILPHALCRKVIQIIIPDGLICKECSLAAMDTTAEWRPLIASPLRLPDPGSVPARMRSGGDCECRFRDRVSSEHPEQRLALALVSQPSPCF